MNTVTYHQTAQTGVRVRVKSNGELLTVDLEKMQRGSDRIIWEIVATKAGKADKIEWSAWARTMLAENRRKG
jgi:hypothetical protein